MYKIKYFFIKNFPILNHFHFSHMLQIIHFINVHLVRDLYFFYFSFKQKIILFNFNEVSVEFSLY
jgi:hypothetical protein